MAALDSSVLHCLLCNSLWLMSCLLADIGFVLFLKTEQPQVWKHRLPVQSAESSAEEKWNSVRSNPELWWDNRLNKRNPKGPDYSLKDKSGGSIALWLNSRDTPEWAKQELQIAASALQSSGFTDMN